MQTGVISSGCMVFASSFRPGSTYVYSVFSRRVYAVCEYGKLLPVCPADPSGAGLALWLEEFVQRLHSGMYNVVSIPEALQPELPATSVERSQCLPDDLIESLQAAPLTAEKALERVKTGQIAPCFALLRSAALPITDSSFDWHNAHKSYVCVFPSFGPCTSLVSFSDGRSTLEG